MFRPGDTLRGYTIRALLGEGGMARVYAATRELDGEQVALKVLHQGSPEAAQRAQREAEALQGLDHPHVVRVLDVLEVHGKPALVMRLVLGPSLRQWLDAGRPTAEEALTVFRGVLAGVSVAHGQGLIHRDIKPGNVLLSLEEEGLLPKVADFGLAKGSDSAGYDTRTGVMLGTPGYMAPEQIRDAKRADSRADVYALGVLLYELACGARPFVGHDLIAVYQDMMARSYVSPLSHGASPAVAAVIERALSPEPTERPPDAAALQRLLDPGATYHYDSDDEVVLLGWRHPGAQRARSMAALPEGAVDPMLPALQTPVAAPEGLIGRESDLAALCTAVASPGLVTLRGPAGIGKTSLLMGLCHEEGRKPRTWVGGVWWIGLRNVSAPELSVASALGVADPAHVADALAGRGKTLLVLDEAEEVATALAKAVERWCRVAPELTVVCSSRRSLGSELERVHPVAPLSVPDAMALFLRKVRVDRPAWTPTSEERGVLCELVAALDCLPLALELAAARSRLMSPGELLERMVRRLDLLRRRDGDARSASLRGAIQESWVLLDAVEQDAVRFLSVIRGDVAVGAADALLLELVPDPITLLETLVDASWLVPRQGRDGPRFRMLASLRHFAAEQLDDATRKRAWAAHQAAWLPRARRAAQSFRQTGDPEASALLAEELEDLLAIAERTDEAATATDARVIAGRWLCERGHIGRAVTVAQAAVASGPSDPEAHLLLSDALAKNDSRRARIAAERAEELAEDDLTWARARVALAATEEGIGGVNQVDLERVIEIARREHSPLLEAAARIQLGSRHLRAGAFTLAEEAAEEAQALYSEARHRPRQAVALSLMGLSRIRDHRVEEAEEPLREAARTANELGDRRSEADALGRLSLVLAQANRREDARRSLERALVLCRQVGNVVGEGYCLANLGALEPDPALASELFRRAAAVSRKVGNVRLESLAQRNIGVSEILRGLPERAIPALDVCRARLLERGDGDAIRVGAWLAMALVATERDPGDLLDQQAQGVDSQILAVARLLPVGMGDDDFDWSAARDRLLEGAEAPPWDVVVTSNMLDAILGGPS